MTIGESIKAARKKAGLTQKALADRLGIPYQGISQYERGTRNPKPETLGRIASALGITLEELYSSQESGIVSELPDVYNIPVKTEMAMTLDWLARKNKRTLEEEIDLALDSYLNWASDVGKLDEEYYSPESTSQRDERDNDARFYPALSFWLDQLNEDGFLKIYEMAGDLATIGRYRLDGKDGPPAVTPPNYVSAYHVMLRVKDKYPWGKKSIFGDTPTEEDGDRGEKSGHDAPKTPTNAPGGENNREKEETPQNEPQGQKDVPKQGPEE